MGELNLDRIEKALMRELEHDLYGDRSYPEEAIKAADCFQPRPKFPVYSLRNQLLPDNDLAGNFNLNHSPLSIV